MGLRLPFQLSARADRITVSLGVTFVVLLAAVAALTVAPKAQAATCSAAAVTVTPMQSPDGTQRPFYSDDFGAGNTNHSGYVGYELNGASLGSDVWIKLSGFTGGALGLAANQSASIPVRATSQAGHALVYAYLTATAISASAQTFNVEVWNGKPGQSGSTQVCTTTDGFSSVTKVIGASANKITSISVSNASPAVGGSFDVSANGDTGTMGAGPSSDQDSAGNGVFSMAPAMSDSWPADAFTLTGTNVTFSSGTSYRDKLRVYPTLPAHTNSLTYTTTYHFTVRNTTSGATSVFPVQNIASGTQVKYTGTYPGTISQISAPAITTSLVKTAKALTGPPYDATYEVVASNSSSSAVTLDYLRDSPTPTGSANWTFVSGSAKLGGSTIADPVLDSGSLVFTGPFSIPAHGSLTFTYHLALSTTVSNSVVGTVGSVDIGASSGNGNQVSVDPSAPIVTTSSLPNATSGSSYSQALAASGGTGSYTWSITSGALPAGLALTASTGRISGTPTSSGTSSFTATATDGTPKTGSKSFTLTVDAAAAGGGGGGGATDTTAPSGSVSLNGGAGSTSSTTLTVGLSATDDTGVTAYRIAQGTDCSGAAWTSVTAATPFSASASLAVTAGDGTKTVCAQFKDAAGNISTAATSTITLDTVAPTVALSSSATTPVNGAFTVSATFSESVTGFTASDITVGDGSVSALSGSGASYSFTVTPAADGAVTVDIAAGAAADGAGNSSTAATRLSRTADLTRPTVALTSSAPSSTNAAFTVTATFSESVSGFTSSDVTVANGTLSGLSGSGTTYTFTVTPGADGTVTVDVPANGATDAAGNGNTAATQLTRTYDATPPTVALASSAGNPLNHAFTVTATFSESVTGFTAGDVSVANATVSAFSGSGASYSFTVTPAVDGTVTVDVASNVAADAATNGNTAATQLARTYDATPPTVALSSSAGDPLNHAFTVTATFSESVGGFDASDLVVGNGTASGFSGSGASYSFTITPSADGAVTVDVPANAGADAAGNGSTAAARLSRSYDATPPTLALATTATSPLNGAFTVTATFSESVTGFDASDLAIGNGTASAFSGSGSTYSFSVTPAADGAVTVDVAAGAASDAAGNASTAAARLSRTADLTRPTVALTTAAGDPVGGSFSVTATFSESVTGFDATDLSLGNGTASAFSGSGSTYSFTVTPVADGAVTIDIASGAAADAAGNLSTAATRLTRTADTSVPGLSLSTTAGDPVAGAFTVSATFSKSVTGFDATDVTVGNGTLSGFAGSGTGYSFTVTPTADGAVTVSVGANAASDALGNGNTASSLSRTADLTAPGLTLSTARTTVRSAFTVTATFSKNVSGFDAADVALTNGTVSNLSGSGASYTFTVTPVADGAVTVDVAAGAAHDTTGNASTAARQLVVIYDTTAPTVVIDGPASPTVDSVALLALTASETATFTCSLDGAAFAACTSPFTTGELAAGDHALTVRATDTAGNTGEATHRWTIVAPTVSFTTRPDDPSDDSVTFAWSSTGTPTYTCTLDDGTPSACASPLTVSGLVDGAHVFTVEAVIGHVLSGTSTVRWTSKKHIPRPDVRIIPKISPTDMLGRPQPFMQSVDAPHSLGPFTRRLQVKLHIPTPTGDDIEVDGVYISNYSDFHEQRRFAIAADELYDWELLAGPSGDRPVYIRFGDSPDAPVGQATIVLDQELPTLAPTPIAARTAARSIVLAKTVAADGTIYCGAAPRRWLRLPGADGFSGLNALQIASDPSHPCAWRPYLPTISYRLPGRVIYVRIEDRVGNVSDWYRLRTSN